MKFVRILLFYVTCLLLSITNERKIQKSETNALATRASTASRSKAALSKLLRKRSKGSYSFKSQSKKTEIKYSVGNTYTVVLYSGTSTSGSQLFSGEYLYIGETTASVKGIAFKKSACTSSMTYMAYNGDYCYLPYREITKIEEGGTDYKWGNIITTKNSGSFFQYLKLWWRCSSGVQSLRSDYTRTRSTRLNTLSNEYTNLVGYAQTYITNYDLWYNATNNITTISLDKTNLTSQIEAYNKTLDSYNTQVTQAQSSEATYLAKRDLLIDEKNNITSDISTAKTQMESYNTTMTDLQTQSQNATATIDYFKTKAATELDNFKTYIAWLQVERPSMSSNLTTALTYLNSGKLDECIAIIKAVRPFPES
jgi:hypothetical protein